MSKVKAKAICQLPDPKVNNQVCSAVCGVTNHGKTVFVLKSLGSSADNKYYPTIVLKTSLASNPKVSTITLKKDGKALGNVARHANSITYARADGASSGSIYICTGNPKSKTQVYKVSSSGKVEKELSYINSTGAKDTISLISYYGMIDGKMMFIVNGTGKDGRKKYILAYLDGNSLRHYKVLGYGEIVDDYTGNDFTYSNGKLYHTFFKKSKGIIKYNRIYIYDFSNIDALNGQILTKIDVLQSNADSTYNKKYEIEGVIEKDGIIYAAANAESSNAAKNKDALFKLA